MSNLFQKVSQQAFRAGINPRSDESRQWFRTKLQDMRRINRRELMQQDEIKLVNKSQPLIGSMNMFFYDPKTKEDLPYYDRFPLTIIVGPAPGGFTGLNLHYVNPVARARLLNELFKLAPKELKPDSRLMRLKYDLLKGVRKYKEFEPCFKRYLTSHVKSQITRVPMTDWETAIYLPIQQFKKKSSRTVWADSRKIYSGR